MDTYLEGYGACSADRTCKPCSEIPPINSRTTATLIQQVQREACVCSVGFFRSGKNCVPCNILCDGAACGGSAIGDSLSLPDNLNTSGIDVKVVYWLSNLDLCIEPVMATCISEEEVQRWLHLIFLQIIIMLGTLSSDVHSDQVAPEGW
jgi:hypothetical protein